MSKHAANILKAAYAAANLTFPYPSIAENVDTTFAARHELLLASNIRYSQMFNHLSKMVADEVRFATRCYGNAVSDHIYEMNRTITAANIACDVFELANIHRKELGEKLPRFQPGTPFGGERVTPEIAKLRGISLQ